MAPRKKKAQRRKSKWNADNILTDPNSPLAYCALKEVLANPLAWSLLSAEEKREVACLFPDRTYIVDADTDNIRLDDQLFNDDGFRADCAAYARDLLQGKHEACWLEDAFRAHDRRMMGDFDEFLIERFESDWGELPEEMRRSPCANMDVDAEKQTHDETRPATAKASRDASCGASSSETGGPDQEKESMEDTATEAGMKRKRG